ncbi:MAG: GGDEF domain-containing protein, partial [Solirubrobacteraceae bacterium]
MTYRVKDWPPDPDDTNGRPQGGEDGAVPDRRGGEDPTGRDQAYLRAFELAKEVQAGSPGAAAEIQALLAEARAAEWPEVVRAALFASVASSFADHYTRRLRHVQDLLALAEQDGAPVMAALALAERADMRILQEDSQVALGSEEDLARATVLLESVDGPVMERISAHNACARAFCDRWLWEIADEQYAAALKLAPAPPPRWAQSVLPAIVYNRSEMQVTWACVLRQLGDHDGVEARRQTWETVMAAASTVDLPSPWRDELDSLGLLLAAIAGRDTSVPARTLLARLDPAGHPGAWPVGWLHLAIALCEQRASHVDRAAEAVGVAVAEIDSRGSPDAYDLAQWLAMELEGEGRETAGLRYAQRLLSLRWEHRLSVLGSTLGRIKTERMRREHDVLTQQVHLDDLTGLLNRRGFARYLEAVDRQAIESMALLVADLDHFKSVNDRYGHRVGDSVLVTAGRLLQAHVRTADCAVRLGGDEFAIVLADTGLDVARRRAEALADAVRREPWDALAPGLSLSVSVGVAAGSPQQLSE